jgi:hypothetical protein
VLSAFQMQILSRHTKIIFVSLLFSAVFIIVDGDISPRIKDGTSLLLHTLNFVSAACLIFLMSGLIFSAVCLLRRRWISSLCYFISALLAPASMYASAALKGDRFTFTADPHSEIAAVYSQRRSEFERVVTTPRLIDLGDQCHPPGGCACWIVLDPKHMSGVEKEIGGWHRPDPASVFPIGTPPEQFAIVNVRLIDTKAYSVLGCVVDWTALKPV